MKLTSSGGALAVATVLLALAGALGCKFEMPPACKDFYESLTDEQQEDQFPTYPLEKQLEVYHCGMQYRPPIRIWAWEISKRGEQIIPDLVQRLKAEPDQARQADLIYIFLALSQQGYLYNRDDVVEVVREKVSHMGRSRGRAQDSLDEIEKNYKNPAPGEPSGNSD
jgi:hypothetical protein